MFLLVVFLLAAGTTASAVPSGSLFQHPAARKPVATFHDLEAAVPVQHGTASLAGSRDGKSFVCARLWSEPNYTGGWYEFLKGANINFGAGGSDVMSSAWVQYGCSLQLFSLNSFQGTSWTFTSSAPDRGYFTFPGNAWDNNSRSGKCTCAY